MLVDTLVAAVTAYNTHTATLNAICALADTLPSLAAIEMRGAARDEEVRLYRAVSEARRMLRARVK